MSTPTTDSSSSESTSPTLPPPAVSLKARLMAAKLARAPVTPASPSTPPPSSAPVDFSAENASKPYPVITTTPVWNLSHTVMIPNRHFLPPVYVIKATEYSLTPKHRVIDQNQPNTMYQFGNKVYELLGDKSLSFAVVMLIRKWWPALSASAVHHIHEKLVNNETLREVCLFYGLERNMSLPRTGYTPDQQFKYEGDVVEAFLRCAASEAFDKYGFGGLSHVWDWIEAVFSPNVFPAVFLLADHYLREAHLPLIYRGPTLTSSPPSLPSYRPI